MKNRAENLLVASAIFLLFHFPSSTALAQGTAFIQITNSSFVFYQINTNQYFYKSAWGFLSDPFTWNPGVTPCGEPVAGSYTNRSGQILFWDYNSNYDGSFEVASNSGSNLANTIWYYSETTLDRPKWVRKNHSPVTRGTFLFASVGTNVVTVTTNVLTGVLPNVHMAVFPLTDGTMQTFYTNWPYPPMYLRCVLVCQRADRDSGMNMGDELDINSIYDECANPYVLHNGFDHTVYLPNTASSTNNIGIGGGGMVFGCGYINGRIFCSYDGQPTLGGLQYGSGESHYIDMSCNMLQGFIFPVATDGQYYQNTFTSFSFYALKIYWY